MHAWAGKRRRAGQGTNASGGKKAAGTRYRSICCLHMLANRLASAPPPPHLTGALHPCTLLLTPALLLQLRCPTWGKPNLPTASSQPTPRGRAAPQPSTLVRAQNDAQLRLGSEQPGPFLDIRQMLFSKLHLNCVTPTAPLLSPPACLRTSGRLSHCPTPAMPPLSAEPPATCLPTHPLPPLACRWLCQLHRLLLH